MSEIKNLWSEIENDVENTDIRGLMSRSLLDEVGLSLGMDTFDGKKILIQAIEHSESIDESDFPSWEGVEFEIRNISKNQKAITLKLHNIELEDIFNALINDLYNNLLAAEDNIDAVRFFISTLNKWYEFFKKFDVKILSEQRQRGIYGELYFLQSH